MANPPVEKDRLIEHEYDGIKEYDNPMPRWWLLTFYGTVIFSVIYALNIGPVGSGEGRIAQYEASVAAAEARMPKAPEPASPERLAALAADPAAVSAGQTVFTSYCASCHGPDGGGLIGPNLADDHWLHGGSADAIYQTIAQGVLAKGMPPWEKSLKPDQLEQVAAYVVALRGTSPTNPKAPEGEVYTP